MSDETSKDAEQAAVVHREHTVLIDEQLLEQQADMAVGQNNNKRRRKSSGGIDLTAAPEEQSGIPGFTIALSVVLAALAAVLVMVLMKIATKF